MVRWVDGRTMMDAVLQVPIFWAWAEARADKAVEGGC